MPDSRPRSTSRRAARPATPGLIGASLGALLLAALLPLPPGARAKPDRPTLAKGIFLTPEGHVGVGLTNPADALSIYGETARNQSMTLSIGNRFGEAKKAVHFVDDTGQVVGDIGVFGRRLPSTRVRTYLFIDAWNRADNTLWRAIHIENGVVSIGKPQRTGKYRLYVDGDVSVRALHQTSDRRLKRDIEPVTDAAERARALRPVRFRWDPDAAPGAKAPDDMQLGFVAQEVAEAIPEAVTNDGDGHLAVSTTAVVAVLAGALIEQSERLEDTERRLADLEARLAALEKASEAAR